MVHTVAVGVGHQRVVEWQKLYNSVATGAQSIVVADMEGRKEK